MTIDIITEHGIYRHYFRKVVLMARTTRARRTDGRKRKSFVYDGHRYYVYGNSEPELSEKERLKRNELEKGTLDRKNPTLNKYYEFFTERRRKKVKEATIRCQSFQFRNCADVKIGDTGKTLGEFRIRDITARYIQEVQAKLEESSRNTETVNNCMAHLSHVFNAAVKDDTIDKNPCKCLERIKREEPPARDTIHRALTETETKIFFEAAKDSFYINAFILMIQTGLRIGEVGALTLADVNQFEQTIRVTKTITKNEIGTLIIGDTPKTDAGNREVPLTERAMKCIRDQDRMNKMISWNKKLRTIFKSPEGELLREYSVNREIAKICKATGIEKFTCHAFRATFATRFIEQRPQDYKLLSEILGHANTSITLDLYTHAMKSKKIQAMRDINIAL